LKIMDMMSCHSLPSLQTLTPLNICRVTWRGSWPNMRSHLRGYWHFGRGCKRNGTRLGQQCVITL
jgi:hypothetical protein